MLNAVPVRCFRPLRVKNPRFRGDPRSFKVRYKALLYSDDYQENYYLEVPCGKCYLCRKRRANGWRIRLFEEVKSCPQFYYRGKLVYRAIFVCFTYDDDHLPNPESRDNIADHIRKWRDLWRKKYGKSPRYFCTTDKGSQYGRLHLHLLIFNPYDYKLDCPLELDLLSDRNFHWRNGMARCPSWLESSKGITYVTGYITGSNLEQDALKHGKPICKEALEYVPFIFVSNGLGANMLDRFQSVAVTSLRKWFLVDNWSVKSNSSFVVDRKTGNYLYRVNGFKYGLPSYYRYKLVPYELRWHANLVYKKEVECYRFFNDVYIYSLSGFNYDYDQLERLYNSSYKKFDVDERKYIKL